MFPQCEIIAMYSLICYLKLEKLKHLLQHHYFMHYQILTGFK